MSFRQLFRSHSSSATPIDPHEWKLPHRFPTAQNADERPQIPDPAIFRDLRLQTSEVALATPSLPSASDLAVHLCLLECLYKFKQDAIRSENLDIAFQGLVTPEQKTESGDEKGIVAQKPLVKEEVDTEDEGYKRRKWNLVVKLAVARFELWWQKVEGIMNQAAAYAPIHTQSLIAALFTKDYMPPLDVLMVWHSYILQPADFKSDCSEFGKQKLFNLGLPWKAIHDTIDREEFSYNLTKPAEIIFRTKLSQSPDFLKDVTTPPSYSKDLADRPMTNLIDAVHSQEPLIERAHRLLWIRSPALHSSLSRTLQAYQRSLPGLLKASLQPNPLSLSFDLLVALQTHRLCPLSYDSFVEKSIGEGTGENYLAYSTTKSREIESSAPPPDYAAQDEHSICFCWTCEAIKAATSSDTADVRALTPKQQLQIRVEVGFHMATESARASGRKMPVRNKETKAKKEDIWEEDYGVHYYTKTIPAKYDKAGNMVKKEEKVVMREQGYCSSFLWTMAG